MSRSKDFFIPRWPNKDSDTEPGLSRKRMTYDFLINDKKKKKKTSKEDKFMWFWCETCEDDFKGTKRIQLCKWCKSQHIRLRRDDDI